MSIGQRIQQARESAGLNQSELAAALGVKPQSVQHWEADRNAPRPSRVVELAKRLQVSVEWLQFGTGRPLAPNGQSEAQLAGYLSTWDSHTPLDQDEVELPFFREVELSAGSGATQVVENHGFKLRFSKSTLRRMNVQPEHAACVSVVGNSMEPMLYDGSTVGVNLAETTVRDGALYAIDHDGMLRVKILHRLPGGGLRIRSLNHSEYPDEDLDGDYVQRGIRIIGKVFWYSGLIH